MRLKRCFDLFFTVPGFLFLFPFFGVIACWIKLDSPGPVFFRQKRIGQYGKPFNVLKFRTMVKDAEKKGAKITVSGDARITRCGRILRKYKLDELPQLINVLKGEMSLVGPRPEVPEYVEHYPEKIKKIVLSVPPGITDYASLEFRNENDLLKGASDPQAFYINEILPKKLEYYVRYVENRSIIEDFSLIIRTIWSILKKT